MEDINFLAETSKLLFAGNIVVYFPIITIHRIAPTEKIKEYRKELKMTQEELAEAVDVARQTIIALEQGRYNPSLILAHRITKALKRKYIEEVFKLEDIET
jgi:putative transcriptional regulator